MKYFFIFVLLAAAAATAAAPTTPRPKPTPTPTPGRLTHRVSCVTFSRPEFTTQIGSNETLDLVFSPSAPDEARNKPDAEPDEALEEVSDEEFDEALRSDDVELYFVYLTAKSGLKVVDDSEVIRPLPPILLPSSPNGSRSTPVTFPLEVQSIAVGGVVVLVNATSTALAKRCHLEAAFFEVHVEKAAWLHKVSDIVGWIYMILWSVAWYPQIHLNFRKKSVAGFSLDSMLFNNIDDAAYVFYTLPLYYNEGIRDLYQTAHPHSIVPVEINDIAAVVHTTIVLLVLSLQCVFYPNGGQKISRPGWLVLGLCSAAGLIGLIVLAAGAMDWLQYISIFSYVKIFTSLIKYAPQAWLNFRQKSTEGYSVGNMLFDFFGSFFSLMQMFLIGFNRSDIWAVIGNPAKLGLGIVSLSFCTIYMVQHYIIYPQRRRYESIVDKGTDTELDANIQTVAKTV